jgi:hypothetical protein
MASAHIRSASIILLLLLTAWSSGYAADAERERRLVKEIDASLFDGELIRLESGGLQFAAVELRPETENPRGAVILLHGRGFHADWPDTINPLRTALSEQGWHTLSLQMPVLEKDAKYFDYLPVLPEAFPRIEATIHHLAENNIQPVVLVAHSCGAHMAMAWLEETGDHRIDAFVGIGMGATDYKQPMQRPFPFAAMTVPILDVYGGDDYPAVLRMAPERLVLIRQGGHLRSSQIEIPGADHYFKSSADALISSITAWIDALSF